MMVMVMMWVHVVVNVVMMVEVVMVVIDVVDGDEALNLPMSALKLRGARTWLGTTIMGEVTLGSGDDGNADAAKHLARRFLCRGCRKTHRVSNGSVPQKEEDMVQYRRECNNRVGQSQMLSSSLPRLQLKEFSSSPSTPSAGIDKCINENVKEAVQDALQALIHELFRELSEFEMKEILCDMMFESGSYQLLPKHTALYEDLEASIERENREEFMDVTAKSRKRRRDDQDPHPPPPMGSDQSKKQGMILILLVPNRLQLRCPQLRNDMHLSYSDDTDADHLSKIKTRPDWLKFIPEEETLETPEPDWVIPPNDLPEPENN
ncbi:hypothetical protein Tco_1085143 [Tanacetum coccineum]